VLVSKGFNCTSEENDSALALLRRRSWLALRSKIDEHTSESALLTKLKGVFEDKFRYDSEGVPRVWKPEDDIDGIFKKARESVSLSTFQLKYWKSLADDVHVAPGSRFDPTLRIDQTGRFIQRIRAS